MSNTTKLLAGQIYGGFRVLSVENMEDYNSLGIFLQHEKSGMQIFHMLNDDQENLFSFGFKTPSENSSGVAHIVEHSVLCGSKHFPLKDPFIRLANQSLKTFLNAMTFPDKTVYPASSVAEQDYFNLMAVYGDAVFFPLLSKNTFLQEGHRFELNKKGGLDIQGVVYNEMKGSYSSFESVVQDKIVSQLFADSSYRYDSGGDPVEIPELTYEQFLAFHKKYYHPANCYIFLYGNISTEKQIDFINEKFLSNFDFDIKDKNDFDYSSLSNLTFSKGFEKRTSKVLSGPFIQKNCKKDDVTVSWNMGEACNCENYLNAVLLAEILIGHNGSPLNKALVDCNLGEDISPNCGLETDLRYIVFTCGLRGVKKGCNEKVVQVIFDVLKNLVENGINKDDLEAAILSIDFNNREIVRSHGPYSLVLMQRAYRTWLNGKTPFEGVMNYQYFSVIKEKIKKNPQYIQELLKEFLINNKDCLCLTMQHKKDFNKRNDFALRKKIKSLKKSKTRSEWKNFLFQVAEEQKRLNKHQMENDDEQKHKLLPHIRPCELVLPQENENLKEEILEGVKVFSSEQSVNGITYIQLCFPVDCLNVQDFPYLNHFASCITNVGFNGMDWAKSASCLAKVIGGFNANLFNSSVTEHLLQKASCKDLNDDDLCEKLYEYDPCCGRIFLMLKIKVLNEKLEEGLSLFFDLLQTVDFKDLPRIRDLTIENKNDLKSSIIPTGHDYAVSRSCCTLTRSKAIDEIFNGFCQLYTILEIEKENTQVTASRLQRLKNEIFNSGFIINIVSDKQGNEAAKEYLKKQIKKFSDSGFYTGKLKKPSMIGDEQIFELTKIEGDNSKFEYYIANTQVGFAARSFCCNKFGTKQNVLEGIYGHYLSNNILWDKIRTAGGAYGIFAYTDPIEGIFSLVSFRDPDPFRSVQVFEQTLEKEFNTQISQEEFERLITGCFSKEIQPRSPAAKGAIAFIRRICGITKEERVKKLNYLLSANLNELNDTRKDFSARIKQANSAIIFTKTKENPSKIIDLCL
ncbi:MAG: insulinase family protein [Treponemataceae bacterium]